MKPADDMNNPQHREEEIFDAALALPAAERAAYLDRVCAGDAALRQRVEILLNASGQNANPLDRPPVASAKTVLISAALTELIEQPGLKIGRYKLREKIGEGGCGVVYVADQEDPVRRRVALKIIKLGMDTRQVIARFEAERQVLALMDHPNIAKVLDGGATETGRPYFVMELVRGIKITDYCDENNLSTEERLKLFIQVCKAVQHAHQKGIIHRDIKPSNVLVTLHDGVPVPKVIDFGIAKATGEQRLTDKTIYTAFEQFLGTPAYMSPEQAEMSGLDIDTRSDIYSLGVLLYELLTGRTPFDPQTLMQAGIDQMRRIIREQEPARPSTCLNTLTQADLTEVASHRRVEAPKLRRAIEGDLDWIVMKLLEKDRTRRYETANGVAADIQRHLDNEPVVARPPSAFYQFQKILRRNQTAVKTFLVVFFFVFFTSVFDGIRKYYHAEHERRVLEIAQHQARENFDQARAAVDDLLEVADNDLYDVPGMQALRVKLMRTALERYKTFLNQSSTDPAPRAELARLYIKYGFAAHEIGEDYNQVTLPAYQAGFAIQQQLVKDYPTNRSFRADLGWTIIYWKLWGNTHPEAKDAEAQAQAIFEPLVQENPTDPFARSGLVWALGFAEVWPSKDDEYFAAAKKRQAILEQLVKEFPTSAEFRRDLANHYQWYPINDDGKWLTNTNGGFDRAAYITRLNWANDLRAAVVADMEQTNSAIWLPLRPRDSEALLLKPSLVWAKRDLARGWLWTAREHEKLKQWPQAIALADRATVLYGEVVPRNPSIVKFATELRDAFTQDARIAEESGDASGAQSRRSQADSFWHSHSPATN
jgi:serine/threonine protein kinase